MAEPHPAVALVLALVLPSPERRRWASQVAIDVPRASFVVGLVEAVGATLWLVHNGLVTMQAIAARNAALLVGEMDTMDEAIAYNLSGVANVLEWLASPLVWVMLSVVLVGMTRMVAFWAAGEASGEFFVWAFVRLTDFAQRRGERAAQAARFGPARPDRFVREAGSDLVLLTSHIRLEWNEDVTVEIDGRFYNPSAPQERRLAEERRSVYAYALHEQPENAVIRRLVRYEPHS